MTIDVQRAFRMPEGRYPADEVGADLERFYRLRPDIRYNVTLSLEIARPRSVSVVFIRTLNRGRGHASVVMDEIVRSADHRDVTLDLDARALERGDSDAAPLGQRALVDFYHRRGFRAVSSSEGSVAMRRLAPSLRRTP